MKLDGKAREEGGLELDDVGQKRTASSSFLRFFLSIKWVWI